MLNLKGTVYVPKKVTKTKLEAIKFYGINIKKYDGTSGETEIHARKVAEKQEIPFISPYNDIDIVAGQGTVGYEIWEQLQDINAVFVCIFYHNNYINSLLQFYYYFLGQNGTDLGPNGTDLGPNGTDLGPNGTDYF